MNTQPSKFPDIVLYPAKDFPLTLKDHTAELIRGQEDWIEDQGMEGLIRCLYLEDKDQDVRLPIDADELSIAEIERLAAGESLRTPCGKVESPGSLRLLRGHEDGVLTKTLVEFIPVEAVPQGIEFNSWFRLRFPHHRSFSCELADEDWWVMFHGLWAEETDPAPTLSPTDGLLHRAALNNQEHLLEAILKRQPSIEVPVGRERDIAQTPLGIAMENTGMFGSGPGFADGCHRRFRVDDFTYAEDMETWVPRAERIADRLKAAGAIDYLPILKACRAGHTGEVEAMLKAGFPPNFTIYGHTTALCEAVHGGHEDLCDLLLCHGADPNRPRPFTTSMIFGGEIYPVSIATEHPAILKRLLEAGADPSISRDDSDETPVVIVSDFETQENAEAVFDLVDFASIRGKYGRSGVFYLDAKNLEFLRDVIPMELLDAHDDLGMTPLLHAIVSIDSQKALLLIEMGADPTLPGMGWDSVVNAYYRSTNIGHIPTQALTPIQAALIYDLIDLVEILTDRGVEAQRHSQIIKSPQQVGNETLSEWRAELDAVLDTLNPTIIVKSNGDDFEYDEAIPAMEAKLATVLLNDPRAVTNHPEWFQAHDLVDWAEGHDLHPALVEPFRSGCKLSKRAWLKLAVKQIDELKEEAENFSLALNGFHADEERPDARNMLNALNEVEVTLQIARGKITRIPSKRRDLSSEVCARASGDFAGGTARGRRDAKRTGESSMEGFAECLKESLEPGSTMDFGKLVQALNAMIPQLEEECAELKRQL